MGGKGGLSKKITETINLLLEKIKLGEECPYAPIQVHPVPQNVTLFGNEAFADVIMIRIAMRPCWIRIGPKSNERTLIRDREGHRHREAGNVKMDRLE